MSHEPFSLQYRTTKAVPRIGPWGWLCAKIAAHPLRAGALFGAGAVLIAALRAPGGFQRDPVFAAILAAMVLGVWIVIIFATRGFFRSQLTEQIEVVRRLEVNEDELRWLEAGALVLSVIRPKFSLHVLEQPPDKTPHDEPWPALLIAQAPPDQRFILETRVMVSEAKSLPPLDQALSPDELLPSHVASPLLARARRAQER